MGKPLRALIVEDLEADAVLAVRELRRGGFDVTFERVETQEAMSAALAQKVWDVVISDYSMPHFSGPRALALLKQSERDLPFIIVSGTVGEDVAVESIQAGANDFMVKGKLARLVPAVERELRNVALRAERLKMQKQLLVSDRMASVGTLAAGLAHEINNPLAALMANLAFVTDDVSSLAQAVRTSGPAVDDGQAGAGAAGWIADRLREIEEPLRDARESADRVRNIVRDLKIFSRSDEEEAGAVDVHRILESSFRMAWNEVRHRARLVKEYGDVPPVLGNDGRLGQVFLNLIMNAAQAIPEGRTDANEIRVVTRRDEQGQVVVEVHDTGSGIPESDLPRIFEPFFTTKPIGVGTGLGLAICHGIVANLGGLLTVESEAGKGSVFRVILQPAQGHLPVPAPVPAAVPAPRRGRILVIDDEPVLCAAVQRMLSVHHEVTALTDARYAIERVARGERFDVILCDLMMPDVTGMDLHAEILRLEPALAEKVVFLTGGAFTPRAQEFLDQVHNPTLAKPFEVATLKALIQDMLH